MFRQCPICLDSCANEVDKDVMAFLWFRTTFMPRLTKQPRPMHVYASVMNSTEAVTLPETHTFLFFLKFKNNWAVLCLESHWTKAYNGLLQRVVSPEAYQCQNFSTSLFFFCVSICVGYSLNQGLCMFMPRF